MNSKLVAVLVLCAIVVTVMAERRGRGRVHKKAFFQNPEKRSK